MTGGILRVRQATIAKVDVTCWRGRELSACERLGLDPDRVYRLLRPSYELARAAAGYNGLPIVVHHHHTADQAIGVTGNAAAFDGYYLRNDLELWDREIVDIIRARRGTQLSSRTHYTLEWNPSVYFDGVQHNLEPEHVSLAEVGKAGPDVCIRLAPGLMKNTDAHAPPNVRYWALNGRFRG